MDPDHSSDIGQLLDPECQSHIIEVMNEWCSDKSSSRTSVRADLVDQEISKPIRDWISERSDSELPHFNGLEAANVLASKAEDIIYILRHQTCSLYPEHISSLNQAWTQFQRSITSDLYCHNRMLEQTLEVSLENQSSIESAVAEELCRRAEQEAQDREKKKRKRLRKWQQSGTNSWEYNRDDRTKWLAEAKVILKENPRTKALPGNTKKHLELKKLTATQPTISNR